MTEESLKNPSGNATAHLYNFINLYYVLQRKAFQYKDIRHIKEQVHKDLITDPLGQKKHNSLHKDFLSCTPSLLQDLAPIFWI